MIIGKLFGIFFFMYLVRIDPSFAFIGLYMFLFETAQLLSDHCLLGVNHPISVLGTLEISRKTKRRTGQQNALCTEYSGVKILLRLVRTYTVYQVRVFILHISFLIFVRYHFLLPPLVFLVQFCNRIVNVNSYTMYIICD